MRLLVAGLSESDSQLVFAALGTMVDHGGVLPDWRRLEAAVEQARPEAVMLYLGSRPGQALTMARRIMTLYPHVQFIGLADAESPELVSLASEAGLADLALLEHGTKEIVATVSRLAARRTETRSTEGQVLALIGAKGGVGTTTVALNLAAELAANKQSHVILVDLHLYMGDVAASLDMVPDPSALWFLTRGSQADGKMWSSGPPRHRTGFHVLGLDGDLRNAEQVTAEQVVFMLDALRKHFDYVVLDCGSNLGEISLAACSASDQALHRAHRRAVEPAGRPPPGHRPAGPGAAPAGGRGAAQPGHLQRRPPRHRGRQRPEDRGHGQQRLEGGPRGHGAGPGAARGRAQLAGALRHRPPGPGHRRPGGLRRAKEEGLLQLLPLSRFDPAHGAEGG